ncbi:helix-turn-helix domain-containing protein [Butyrivibrio sp. MC2013]|uniref:helix-turn-helix domain-containing protein n=1 Tax=Butyrivibrio sp. MC2013 TaxID=1280686 RepID=UPI0006874603|nr:helix-turn-helix transcriptional regulator [Butyrivibrio sp. MC2013]
MDNNEIGKVIKEARTSKGYTQKELGGRLGVTDKAVSKWELGKSLPDITLLESLSRELDLSVNRIVGIADTHKEEIKMKEELDRKIKIRLIISFVVLAVVLIRILSRIGGNLFTYWMISSIIDEIIYAAFLVLGVSSLISCIILYLRRRRIDDKEDIA